MMILPHGDVAPQTDDYSTAPLLVSIRVHDSVMAVLHSLPLIRCRRRRRHALRREGNHVVHPGENSKFLFFSFATRKRLEPPQQREE